MYLLLSPIFVLVVAGIVSLVEALMAEQNQWSVDHD
jgi:hypothetical protein